MYEVLDSGTRRTETRLPTENDPVFQTTIYRFGLNNFTRTGSYFNHWDDDWLRQFYLYFFSE